MRILAFDQSSKVTGWSVFDDNEYLKSGIIDKHKISDINIRIGEMGTAICEKIEEIHPNIVIIENIQAQSAISTVIALARLQGFILGWCYVHKIRVEIIGPTEWRKELKFQQGAGVKRQELKQQSINYVKKKYGFDLSEDECEAIAINDGARMKFKLV